MNQPHLPDSKRSWARKFADAGRGVLVGMRGQKSFAVHLPVAALVVVAAAVLRVTAVEWCLLVLAIAGVLAAELFNSALEWLARGVEKNHNEEVGRALDIGSGAVLVAAIGAAVVGLVVFVPRVWVLLAG